MRSASTVAALVAVVLGVWLPTSQATVYRWTGANGVVHFSQFPPNGRKATKISNNPIDTVPGRATAAPKTTTPAGERNSQQSGHAAPQPPRASQQACHRARANLDALQSGRRVKIKMPDGSTHWLTPAEHSKRLTQTKAFLARRCK